MEDKNVISRLKQGDLNGLAILVNRYQSRAVHSAYLIVFDRYLAEDIVQTAFVKVVERIHQFDDERPYHAKLQSDSHYHGGCSVSYG